MTTPTRLQLAKEVRLLAKKPQTPEVKAQVYVLTCKTVMSDDEVWDKFGTVMSVRNAAQHALEWRRGTARRRPSSGV